LVAIASLVQLTARRQRPVKRDLIVRQVKRRPLPVLPTKTVFATKRLPLWHLTDEVYFNRQIAPNPEENWTTVRRKQARMREQVIEQQRRDMKAMTREFSGFRLPPTIKLGDIRVGQWLDGRISGHRNWDVDVDVGAYNDMGEYVDGLLHVGQMREDGRYVPLHRMMEEVHLGEMVRVRVREVVPTTGVLKFSMRTVEDIPPLFMGKPRMYNDWDLERGMPLTGIVRRLWDVWALIDVGCDRLVRCHVRNHPRPADVYGFQEMGYRLHKYADEAWVIGAQIKCWVLRNWEGQVFVTCCRTRSQKRDEVIEAGGGRLQDVMVDPVWDKRSEAEKKADAKTAAEKETYDPYVPYVKEWLEDAMVPDEETDSWVAKQERELLAEREGEKSSKKNEEVEEEDEEMENEDWSDLKANLSVADRVRDIKTKAPLEEDDDIDEDEEFEDEEFADDEFAADDFADDGLEQANEVGFGPHAFPAKELDGWVLDDADMAASGGDDSVDNKFTEDELEDFFNRKEQDNSGGRFGMGPGWSGSQPPGR